MSERSSNAVPLSVFANLSQENYMSFASQAPDRAEGSFGSCSVNYFSDSKKAVNARLDLDQMFRLRECLNAAIDELWRKNQAMKEAQRAGINLCLFKEASRITITHCTIPDPEH